MNKYICILIQHDYMYHLPLCVKYLRWTLNWLVPEMVPNLKMPKRHVMNCYLLPCILPLLLLAPPCYGSAHKYVNITGDFILAGMFPLHYLTGGARCGTEIHDLDGMQNLEAMIYSLRLANRDILAAAGFTIGAHAVDTCYSETVALERALQFVRYEHASLNLQTHWTCSDGSYPSYNRNNHVVGVVGSAMSSVSIQVASFLRLFNIPQISYAATSPELNDTKRFEYFMRTVPSDVHQALAIVSILKKLRLYYVTGIYEDTSYGQLGFEEIERHAKSVGICIAKSVKIRHYFKTPEDKIAGLREAINELSTFNNADGKIVVIMFILQDSANPIFELAQSSADYDKYIWVGGDGWSGRVIWPGAQRAAANAIAVQPLGRVVEGFDEYFTSLRPETHTMNPWFQAYWEQKFNCNMSAPGSGNQNYEHDCKSTDRISDVNGTYIRNLNAYNTMDAVFAFAHALLAMHTDLCLGQPGVCSAMTIVKGEQLMEYIKNVTFEALSGMEFKFYGNAGPARYSIMNFVTTGTGYEWRQVGTFYDSPNNTNLTFWDNFTIGNYQPSYCSAPCGVGEVKSSRTKCCWTCTKCAYFQYAKDDMCVDCPSGELPNAACKGCTSIPKESVSYDNSWAMLAVSFAALGVVITLIVAIVFYGHRKTPVIMASGKELSFVLLIGVFLSYCSSFVFVAYPSNFSCGTTRFMLGFCYTLCYASILVKTNRIYRVFNIKTKKPKKVKYINARSQLLITLSIVMVEVTALVLWLAFDPPTTTHIHPTRNDNILVCADSTNFVYLGVLLYPFLLMIACIVYAVMTRQTPDGFNETRYIAFGSYSFCIMWIAFVSIYFSVSNNITRVISLCAASSINATVTLITLFITKSYLVICKPEKNTRENVMSRSRTHSAGYDTVDNLHNLSRMVSAVSTWHTVYPSLQSEGTSNPAAPPVGKKNSVSIISMNNVDPGFTSRASDMSALSTQTAVAQILGETEKRSKSNSLGDILFDGDMLDNGYTPRVSLRRSLRSRRRRRTSRAGKQRRPRSADAEVMSRGKADGNDELEKSRSEDVLGGAPREIIPRIFVTHSSSHQIDGRANNFDSVF